MQYYTKHHKKECSICGRLIDVANLLRHENSCRLKSQELKKNVYQLDHDDLFCKFCKKEYKSRNALIQHELRCKLNPERKDFNRLANYSKENFKGQTKYTNSVIAKQANTTKNKYLNGYESPIKGKQRIFNYIYEEHNQKEINKWIEYINSRDYVIPEHKVLGHPEDYLIVSKSAIKLDNTVQYEFEHDYIANILLDGKLDKSNTVHHIDKCRSNNAATNLIVFETNADHKRFHNSKYAYLLYDENSHLFNCILKYDS